MQKISLKVGWRHALLEKEIRQYSTPDASRGDILEKCISVGKTCTDWTMPYKMLSRLRVENAPEDYSTSWQCPISDESASDLEEIKMQIQMNLNEHGIIVQKIQQQYVLQLLMANLVEELKGESLKVKEKENISTNLTIPEIMATLTELVLTDRDSDTLIKIKNILLDWRNDRNGRYADL